MKKNFVEGKTTNEEKTQMRPIKRTPHIINIE